jgi:hypothetical protein
MKKLLSISVIIFMGISGVAWGQSSLDLSSNTIPKGFKGDDIVKAVEALSKTAHVKTQRMPKLVYIADKEDIDRLYVFKLANSAVLSSHAGVWLEKTTHGIEPQHRDDYYLVKDQGEKTRSYIGQTAFGARVRAEDTKEVKYFVSPTVAIGKLPVKPEGGSIGVLFIGKPAKYFFQGREMGYVEYPGHTWGATFDMPYSAYRKYSSIKLNLQEIWVYDLGSGKVLLKQKIEKRAEP